MKNILFVFLLISSALFAQQNDKKWDKVIAYENEGKIKSANEIVLKIYNKAIDDKDEAEIIKCFFYQSKYLQVIDENAQTKILNNLKTDIKRVSTPSKAILNLVYAKCLTDYYARNEYQIKKRTNIATLNDDFLTWTEKNFTDQINLSLKQTLESESILKSTPLIKYESIFDYSTLEKFKTQNLYEYLLKENITMYSQKVHQWEIKKKEFEAYKKQLLGKSSDFIALNLDFVTNENLRSLLNLYQKQEKANPIIDNQLERLLYCKTNLVDSIEDYTRALIMLQKSTNDEISIQKIQLIRAILLSQQASKGTHPDYNTKAITILDSILTKNNNTNAYQSAIQRKDFITSKSITAQLNKNSYSDEYTRAFIQYKNVDHLKVSFFKISQNRINEFRNSPLDKDSLVNVIIKKQKAIKPSDYQLINKKDYFQYSTEVLLPQLKTGNYLVYFESDSDSKETKAFAYETITISNIALLASQKNKTESFQVLDRKTGKPLENVSIKLLNETIKTDKNGFATHDKESNNYNYEPLLLTTENDTILIVKNYIGYNRDYTTDVEEESKGKGKVEFYLDRAIYRPGQTVFYKGIAIQKKQNKTNVVAKTSFEINIRDANNETLKEFEVTTNEFGSFSGEFVLPKTGLTGTYSIVAREPTDPEKDIVYNKAKEEHPFWDNIDFDNSQTSFRVEEYKRPKFEIVFEPKKKTFQINQTIKVDGTAKAFAGSSISDAKVTYTVTRFTNYFRNYYEREENEVVATGETKTDASGKFVIDFIALPSQKEIKEQLPVFNYIVKSSVTDINGETHEAQTTVKVGYHDLMLNLIAPNRIETKNKTEIGISTTNLNGEFLAAKGEIKIYFVSPFANKFKARVFARPDIQSISDQEFEKLFPYENNQKPVSKETETLVYSKNIDSSKDKKLALDFISNYKSGNYRIVFSAKDSFNNAIETSQDIVLFQSNDKLRHGTLVTANQINDDAKKDGFALIKLTSIVPELYVTVSGNYESKMFFQKVYHLENNEVTIKVPVKNEFDKSLKIGFESIFENDSYSNDIEVALKIKEPKLDFNVETFRSKIQPGTNENWSFKLNAINTKSEAEVLASMYDSSLDQFSKSDWGTLAFYDYNYNEVNSKSPLGFEKTYIDVRNLNSISNRLEFKTENTKLMWFGFDFNNKNSNIYLQREYQKQINKKYKKPINAKNISGIVRDLSNLSLPGVSIAVKGTPRSTTTDYDGFFEIEAAPNEELVFTYIGFKQQSIKVAKNKNIDIALTPEENSLSEVVVVGYGTQKKSMLTGAVASVRSQNEEVQEDNNVYNTAGIDDSLESRVAGIKIRGTGSISGKSPIYVVDGQIASDINNINPKDILSIEVLKDEKATALYGSKGANGVVIVTTKAALEALTQVKARKNLSETAFFLPNLRTDSNGKVSFNFTSPEALTAWKLRLMAHNKNAVTGYLEKSVVTQKELMVLPNFPRFFREKDTIVISAKISNITDQAKTGIAILQFFDATTMQPIDNKMLNAKNVKNFTIEPFGNTTATWTISIPEGLQGVQYKILAKSGNFSDGEENILPVLTNNMLITESIPIWVRENSTKEYTFENLKNNNSSTLKNHLFTLEYTSNPSWIAIQSLPYLMEFEHECAEQTFARLYANALASEIISSNPKIATVFEEWKKNGKLNSKLEENEELKAIILAETPWLNDAQSEDEKKKNLALLFDLEKMKTSQEATFDKLKQKQKPSGAFAWFDGSDENEYITRHILAGLGHLSKLSKSNANKIEQISKTGIPFLDSKFLENYKKRTKNSKTTDKLIWINPYSDLHYLYTRSFYLDKYPLSDTLKKATKLYLETAKKDWLSYSLYEKGLAALTLNRLGESDFAKKIIESLKEASSNNEDWGMYWIANKSGWYWYQAPIETQALLIEAFAEVNHDTKSVDAMKVWLLKNKQTKNWPTTKSTTEAVYALLLQGNDWLSVKDNTVIKIGDEKILTKKLSENQKEAETGYIKLNWKADEVKKDMASISIQNKSKVPAYGGIYWQYFEDLDKIKTNSGASLSVSKELYLKKNTLKGDELEIITNKNSLKIGDLVTVRLIITSKEDMEFVHLKDMRASCFEPVNVLSEYQYKDRLGYYMSTKDAATHFFFDRIDKGTYVLEYDIRVNNSGEFSNGITTIESMYAPEFSSHSKGIRVKVN